MYINIVTAGNLEVGDTILKSNNENIALVNTIISIHSLDDGKYIQFELDNGLTYLLKASDRVCIATTQNR